MYQGCPEKVSVKSGVQAVPFSPSQVRLMPTSVRESGATRTIRHSRVSYLLAHSDASNALSTLKRARAELMTAEEAGFVPDGSDEWLHLEPAINSLLAHVHSRCTDVEWKSNLENMIALEIALKMDQTEQGSQYLYSMEVHVRLYKRDRRMRP